MRRIFTAGLATLAALVTASAATAQTWSEAGDAGFLPGTAQATDGIGTLTAITGTISSTTDVDLFQIFIIGGGTFSATTVNQPGTLFDTQLFLFDANGRGVYANDDAAGVVGARSTLPAGHLLTPTAAGLYYLALAPANRDPTSSGGLIFPDLPFTGIFGPTGPGGGLPVSSYTGTSAETGTYTIALTGAEFAVPEPGSLALLAIGAPGLLACVRRRRKMQ